MFARACMSAYTIYPPYCNLGMGFMTLYNPKTKSGSLLIVSVAADGDRLLRDDA